MGVARNTSPRYPGGRRTAYAAAAYVVGFLAMLLGFADQYRSILGRTVVGTEPDGTPITALEAGAPAGVPDWGAASVLFYNAHLVTVDVPLQTFGQPRRLNLLLEAGDLLLVLFLVPPVLLAVAGGLVVRDAAEAVELRFDFGATTTGRYAINGALVTMLGYLPLVLVGTVLPSVGAGVSPNLLVAWVVAGMAYPLAFGGLGAATVHLVGLHPDPDPDEADAEETGHYGVVEE